MKYTEVIVCPYPDCKDERGHGSPHLIEATAIETRIKLAVAASMDAAAAAAEERVIARVAEAVKGMPGAAWGSSSTDGKRLDWLVERAAVLALLDSTGARE